VVTTSPGGTARLRLVRYGGFAGMLLLAGAAVRGGAPRLLPAPDAVLDTLTGPQGPLVTVAWVAGLVVVLVAWWLGRAAVPSTRWAAVTAGLWLLPLLFVPPTGSRDMYAYACQGAVYAAGQDPYRVSAADLPCPWLDSVSLIWRDTPAPYGPLFVVVAGTAVRLTGGLVGSFVLFRLVAVAGVALAAWCVPMLARRCGVPERQARWLVLACPLVGVHLVAGAHNDALMVGLLVAGLLASTGRTAASAVGGGVLLGLAFEVKATAVVVLPFALLLGGRRRAALLAAGAAGAVAVVSVASGLGLGWLRGLAHSGDSVQWTAPPTGVGLTVGYVTRAFGHEVYAVNVTRAIGLAALAGGLVAVWLWAVRAGRLLYGAGLALALTVALSPVFHPWYLAWPLVVLAATSERTRWLAVAATAACFLVRPDGTNLVRFLNAPAAFAMTALVGYVVVAAARGAVAGCRARRPRHGPGSSASAGSVPSATGRTGRDSAG
jgi:alpha-1,6-mannosyltransferase